ncbi:MAG: metallophosphoesterase family protein [Gemmatimonadota bacterium]|jgi:Icc-related predicted phosphoesterase
MRLLLCSDIHCDEKAAQRLVDLSEDADVLVCAGDLAVMRTGLQKTVDVLSAATVPTVLVAGNGESTEELEKACQGWSAAHVLHGSGCEIEGVRFWGLGGATPVTPFGAWSYDIDDVEAAALLEECPEGCVLVTHSPPLGHVDRSGGEHLGSKVILDTIRRAKPELAVCGHIHGCWTEESREGPTRIINAGPQGVWAEV